MRNLIKHTLAIVVFTAVLIWVLMIGLKYYTQHGESIEVPDLKDLRIEDARTLLATRDLKIVVSDSICKGNGLGNLIKDQTPRAGARVKESRKIYITITRQTDCTATIKYNQIIGRPLEFVRKQLDRNKLKLGNLKYIPGGKAENTVIEAYVGGRPLYIEADANKGQKPPKEAQKVPHGTTIDLVLLEGMDAKPKFIPKLNCRRFSEAEFAIMGSKFIMGTLHATDEIADTLSAWVWKQRPLPDSHATMGTSIDLWIMSEKPQGCIDEELEAEREKLRQDSIKQIQQNTSTEGNGITG